MNTAKHLINENMKNAWMKQWSEDKNGRQVFKFMPEPNKKDQVN